MAGSYDEAERGSGELKEEGRRSSSGSRKKPLCCRRGAWGVLDVAGVIFAVLALVCLLAALILPPIIHTKVDQAIDQETIIEAPSSKHFSAEAYEVFRTGGESKGVRIYLSTSWFNITNPDQVLQGAKPVLQEVGPYIYREHRRKLNMVFSSNGEEVSFVLYKYFVWDEEANIPKQGGRAHHHPPTPKRKDEEEEDDSAHRPADVKDRITLISPVVQVLMAQLKETMATSRQHKQMWANLLGPLSLWPGMDRDSLWKFPLKLTLCQANRGVLPVERVTPFVTRSPRDIFFGYCPDPLMLALQRLINTSASIAQRLNQTLSLPPVPRAFPGLYTNLTSEADAYRRTGNYRIHTGKVDRSLVQSHILFQNMSLVHACPNPATGPAWDDKDCQMPACYVYNDDWDSQTAAEHGYTPQWGSDEANRVVGSDGSWFQHPMDKDEIVTWQDDYRRNVILGFQKEHSDWRNIKLRKYIFRAEDFENCSVVPENAGFYQCDTPQGITNVSHTGGFPLFLSKPHFLETAPWVAKSVSGLHPSYNKHETFMDVEPMTGVTMRAAKRIQLNMNVKPMAFSGKELPSELSDESLTPGVRRCMQEEVVWDFLDPVGQGLYFPTMWYDEHFEQPMSVTDEIDKINTAKSAAKELRLWGLVCMGAFLLAAILCFAVGKRRATRSRSSLDEPLIGQ